MSNTKIFGANHGIATSNAIPDNNATALDIESTDGKDYIVIDTTDGSETMKIGSGSGTSDVCKVSIGSNPGTVGEVFRVRQSYTADSLALIENTGAGIALDVSSGTSSSSVDVMTVKNGNGTIAAFGADGETTFTGRALVKGDLTDALQGTVSASSGSTAVTGSGTAFLTEIFEGSAIKLGSEIHSVAAVASNTALTLDAVTAGAHSGITAYTDNSPIFQVQSGDSRSLLEANNNYVRINGRGGPSTRTPSNNEVALFIDGGKPVAGNTDSVAFEINCEGSNGAQIMLTNGGNYLGRFMAQSNKLYLGTQYANQQVIMYPGSRKILAARGDEYAVVMQDSDIKLYQNEASAAGQEICFYKSRDTTDESAATIVADGDVLGSLKFKGANGDAFSEGARIEAAISGTPGNDDLPTSLTFYTTPDGSETPAVNARLQPNGDFGVRKLKGISGVASDLHVSGAGAAGDLKINNGDGRDVIIYNGSSTQTAKFDASAALLHLTGPGGSTGDAANTGSAAPTLYLESSTGNSQDRCSLQMNADGNSGCMIDMYYSGNRKMVIVAQDAEQSITAEDSLILKAEATDAAMFTVTAPGTFSTGAVGTSLTSGTVSTSGSSTTLNGSSTVFTTDFHVGAAIKVGTVVTTVTAIASDTELTLQDAINTSSTGTTCTRDGGELFAVKTGDSKPILSVNATGALGLSSAADLVGSQGNIAIGDASILDAIEEDGVLNTIIAQRGSGNWALASAANNILIGFGAGLDMTNAQRNIAIGTYALDDATSTQNSVAIGTNSGRKSGNDCVYIGHNTGDAATGADNTVIGKGAFSATCSGTNNVAIGKDAMSAFTGSDSIAIGKEALDASSSIYSTAVGYQCLTGLASGALESNTAFGYRAGMGLDSGQQCLFLGSEADTTDVDANNQIAIGHGAVTDSPNQVRLGNTSIADIDGQVALTATSDARVKTNVQDLNLGLDFINALRPVSFSRVHPADWPEEIRDDRYKKGRTQTRDILDEDGNVTGTEEVTVSTATFDVETGQPIKDTFDSTTRSDGLIAQEVRAVCDSLGVQFNGINENSQGKLGLQYSLLVAPLIKAVQELTERVKELEDG